MKTSHLEGWLMVDNRLSGGSLQERAIYVCGHCETTVVKNSERQRERAACRKCSRVICDACAAVMSQTLECNPMEKIIDEALEMGAKEH